METKEGRQSPRPKRTTTLRITAAINKSLCNKMPFARSRDQVAFGHADDTCIVDERIFAVTDLYFPNGVSDRPGGGVRVAIDLQLEFYQVLPELRLSAVEIYIHTSPHFPRFSDDEIKHSRAVALFLADILPEPHTTLFLVGNSRLDAFDGIYYDRDHDRFRRLDYLQFLDASNTPTKTWPLRKAARPPAATKSSPPTLNLSVPRNLRWPEKE